MSKQLTIMMSNLNVLIDNIDNNRKERVEAEFRIFTCIYKF